MKKPRLQETPVGASRLPMIAMLSAVQAKGDHWLSQGEVQSMGRLLGRQVTGARIHAHARKKLYEHRGQVNNHRLSVMYTEADPYIMNLRDDPATAEIRSSPQLDASWKGMTAFYQAWVAEETYF